MTTRSIVAGSRGIGERPGLPELRVEGLPAGEARALLDSAGPSITYARCA
ncbi:hypothetical protein [Micromonospora avicenniae]|nr:hypothetical protein [Micromonospora avicenniae]